MTVNNNQCSNKKIEIHICYCNLFFLVLQLYHSSPSLSVITKKSGKYFTLQLSNDMLIVV